MSYNYFPIYFGDSEDSEAEILHKSLLESLGTAFSNDDESVVSIQANAYARALQYLWSLGKRFVNNADPYKATDFLSRYERIYGLYPKSDDTLQDRREKLALKMSMRGKFANIGQTTTLLITLLSSDVFQSIAYLDPTSAGASVPGGVSIPGGATYPDGPWYSTVSYLPIKTKKPDYMEWSEYYRLVESLKYFLDDFLPAYTTYDWIDQTDYEWFLLDVDANLDRLPLDNV